MTFTSGPRDIFANARFECCLHKRDILSKADRINAAASSANRARRAACLHQEQIPPVIAEPRQAGISQPAPISRVPFYLRDARCEMFAPNDPGPVAMVAMDSPSIAMKRSKVGPPITVKVPIQSLLTE